MKLRVTQAAMIIGVVGALLAGYQGVRWLGLFADSSAASVALAKALGGSIAAQVESASVAAIVLLVCGAAGIAVCGLVLWNKVGAVVGAAVLVVAGVAPVVVNTRALFGAPMVIAGALLLLGRRGSGAARGGGEEIAQRRKDAEGPEADAVAGTGAGAGSGAEK